MGPDTHLARFDNCASLCIFATTWNLHCTLPAMEPNRNVWASAESDSPKTPNATANASSVFKRRLSGRWVGGTISRTRTLADVPLQSPLRNEGCCTHLLGRPIVLLGRPSKCCQTRPERPRRMTDLTRLGVWRQVNPRVATLVGSRKCNSRKKKTFFLVGQPGSQHPHESPNVHI